MQLLKSDRQTVLRVCTALFAMFAGFLNACSSSDDDTITETDNSVPMSSTVSALLFEPCEGTTMLDCGAFEVPLIHGSTDNRSLSINVARLPGTGSGPHEPLLINLGGPGSGIEVLQDFASFNLLPASVREQFDVYGFDQRGVANPLRIDCDLLGNVDAAYPRDQNDVQTLVDDSTMLADACSAEFADQLQWVGSNSVVQDIEILRTKLGTPMLNIIGVSFGTRITALYLERFPNTSGRIILDASLPPGATIESLLTVPAEARQDSFEQMLNVCGTIVPDCDRLTIEDTFVSRVNNLLDEGDQETFNAFFDLLEAATEESDVAEILGPFLVDFALSGNSAQILSLVAMNDLEDDESDDVNDSITLERAVFCADDSTRPTFDSLVTTLGSLNEISDLFAEAIVGDIGSACVSWPEALDPVSDIHTVDGPAALVIGGADDVVTPISWSIATAEAIGGVLLTSDHQGHTTLFVRSNECVDSIAVEYLIDGTLPQEGTRCN